MSRMTRDAAAIFASLALAFTPATAAAPSGAQWLALSAMSAPKSQAAAQWRAEQPQACDAAAQIDNTLDGAGGGGCATARLLWAPGTPAIAALGIILAGVVIIAIEGDGKGTLDFQTPISPA